MKRYTVLLLGCLFYCDVFSQGCDIGLENSCGGIEAGIAKEKIDPNHPNKLPIYPKQSIKLKEEGVALFTFGVDIDGSVISPKIILQSGFSSLDKAALSAISDWKFIPNTSTGNTFGELYYQKIAFWLADAEWIKVGANSESFDMYVRSHLLQNKIPASESRRVLTLLNFRQQTIPEDNKKSQYAHGLSTLIVRDVNCEQKKIKNIQTSTWSEHWANGVLLGSLPESEWKDVQSLSDYCQKVSEKKE